jgi:hypothetical protein
VRSRLHALAVLSLGEEFPGTHRIGVLMRPEAGLDVVVNSEIAACAGNRTLVV